MYQKLFLTNCSLYETLTNMFPLGYAVPISVRLIDPNQLINNKFCHVKYSYDARECFRIEIPKRHKEDKVKRVSDDGYGKQKR